MNKSSMETGTDNSGLGSGLGITSRSHSVPGPPMSRIVHPRLSKIKGGETADAACLSKVRVRCNHDPKVSAMRWDTTSKRLELPTGRRR